ncbi:hypothetical protein CMI47_11615 [Candidatus Pacearchaeota archaeon]|nr:hypothetical protein [Candidatus Pacearchaeota archaeon]|tara:strand:- start:205 stop:426 length:222 start_codon:yes stop_codon:yes gene_type:complete
MPFNPSAFRELRDEVGVNQIGFAELLDISQSLVSFFERGEKRPSLETLDRIYTLARSRGYDNLIFYVPPEIKR